MGRQIVLGRRLSGWPLVIVGLLFSAFGFAQTAEVTRNVNLRPDPSTDNPPIRLLTPPEQVELLEPVKTGGYYHVQTSLGEEGWVWARNVSIIATTPTSTPTTGQPTATPTPEITPTSTPTSSGPATAVDPNWTKGTPAEITFHTDSGTCGPDGDLSGDPETNHLKNRIDVPASYHAVTFDALLMLSILPAGSPISRTSPNWPSVAPQITPQEGVSISVEGFIAKVKKQTSGEKTNCGFTKPNEVDWHVPLVALATDQENMSVVVELTPRVRKDHANWTEANLTPSGPKPLFRISGWLMYDPDHPGHLFDPAHPKPNRFRRTLWEIHPITKIEVWKNGAWVDLEDFAVNHPTPPPGTR